MKWFANRSQWSRSRVARPKAAVFADRSLDEASRFRLLCMVYTQPASLWINLCLAAVIGSVCMSRVLNPWLIGWTIAGLLIGALRLVDYYTFAGRRDNTPLQILSKRYVALAWLLAAYWGSASLVLLITDDPIVHFWFINSLCVFLAGSVARSNPVIRAARGQVFLTLVPLLAVCIVSPDPYLKIYAVLVALYALSSDGNARSLHMQTVRLLLADQANSALLRDLAQSTTALEAANVRLNGLVSTDGLTGIANRRCFDVALATEWGRASRSGSYLTLLLIDIDHFKSFNDGLGHLAGDDCLRRVAVAIAATIVRDGDLAARYGGEEFAVLVPGADSFGAIETGERVRAAVEALAISSPIGKGRVVTVSVGVATVRAPQHDKDPSSLIEAADRSLYRAKRDGRNCVRNVSEAAATLAVAAPMLAWS